MGKAYKVSGSSKDIFRCDDRCDGAGNWMLKYKMYEAHFSRFGSVLCWCTDSDHHNRTPADRHSGSTTGITKEYQGCIHISGKYKYKTKKYMGLCVSVDDALVTGEWSPGKYKQYYESKGKYWEARNEKETKTTDE